MISDLLTCPYCNAQIPHPSSTNETTRVTCPRCDETFPWRPPLPATDQAVSTQPLSPSVPAPAAPQPVQRLPTGWIVQLSVLSTFLAFASLALRVALADNNITQRAFPFMMLLAGLGLVAALWLWFLQTPRSNAAVAGFVLANMASVALLVLPFALERTAFRRGNDPRKPPEQPPPPVVDSGGVAPAQLAGLGYLPDNCNLVAGIHVAELYQQPIGTKLFEKGNAAGPDAEAPPSWLIEQGLGRVESWTGLKPSALDHIVFGLRVDGKLPHLTIVVRTRKPYDPQTVAAAQGKTVPIKHLSKDLFQFKAQPIGYGLLWLADARTLILVWRLDALTDRDRLALPEKPRQGSEGPPAALRKVLAERLARGTLIWWSAVDFEQPQLAGALLPGAAKDEELAKLLKGIRSLTAGLRLQQDTAVLANIECPDPATARQLNELLQRQTLPGLGKPKVAGPEPDGVDSWVSLQLRGGPEAVVRALRNVRLIPGMAKGK